MSAGPAGRSDLAVLLNQKKGIKRKKNRDALERTAKDSQTIFIYESVQLVCFLSLVRLQVRRYGGWNSKDPEGGNRPFKKKEGTHERVSRPIPVPCFVGFSTKGSQRDGLKGLQTLLVTLMYNACILVYILCLFFGAYHLTCTHQVSPPHPPLFPRPHILLARSHKRDTPPMLVHKTMQMTTKITQYSSLHHFSRKV